MPHCSLGTRFEECVQQGDAWFQASKSNALAGSAVFVVGMVFFGVGAAALRFGFVRPVTSYVAAEASPAIEVASEAIGRGLREAGVGAAPSQPPPEETVVRVKCRSCRYLETEDAEFCSKCGRPL